MSSRWRYLLFLVFPLLLAVATGYCSWKQMQATFRLERVVLSGNEHLADDEVRKLAGIRRKANLISLPSRRVFEKLIESPWIQEASVRKEYPDTLRIHITEAEPFALLDLKGRLFLVDEKGKMLEELKSGSIPFLPVISGNPYREKDAFAEAIELVRAMRSTGLLSRKDHIEIIAHKPQELAVNLDGVVVKMGEGEHEDKLERLREIEEEIRERNIFVDYIDLRFANRVVVKPVNEVIKE